MFKIKNWAIILLSLTMMKIIAMEEDSQSFDRYSSYLIRNSHLKEQASGTLSTDDLQQQLEIDEDDINYDNESSFAITFDQPSPTIIKQLISLLTKKGTTLLKLALRNNQNETDEFLTDYDDDIDLFEEHLQENLAENKEIAHQKYKTPRIEQILNHLKSQKNFRWIKYFKRQKNTLYCWDAFPIELKSLILTFALQNIKKFTKRKFFTKNESAILNLMLVNREFFDILRNSKVLSNALLTAVHNLPEKAQSAFVTSAKYNNLYALEAFIIAEIPLDLPSNKCDNNVYETALNCAIRRKNHKLVAYLIKNGASIEATNDENQMVLVLVRDEYTRFTDPGYEWVPAEYERIPIRRANGDSPLLCAVKAKCWRTIKLLIDNGAEVYTQNWKEEEPLLKAIELLHYEDTILFLIRKNPPEGKYLEEAIAEAHRYGKTRVYSRLIEIKQSHQCN